MEGHVISHLPTLTLTVTVPVVTMDPTARTKVFAYTPLGTAMQAAIVPCIIHTYM